MKSETMSERKHSAFPPNEQNNHKSARLSEFAVCVITSTTAKRKKKKRETSGSDLRKKKIPEIPLCVNFLQTLETLWQTSNRHKDPFWPTRLLPPQPNVGTGRPGCQVLQSAGPHHCVLLPVDHLCGCRGGHYHGVYHPSGGCSPEGGLGGQWQVHH